MAHVDVGFLEKCDPWRVESRLFPSKVGGKPAWLDLKNLPSQEDLRCSVCSKQMIFLCQVYAPYEDDEDNFHRTLFIFICKNKSCCLRNNSNNLKVFRNNLRRENDFYPYNPPDERPDPNFDVQKWSEFCKLCGCKAEKHCSNCKKAAYCCREHQIIHWKESHKNFCVKNDTEPEKNSLYLFSEWELVIEPEEMETSDTDENKELAVFEDLKKEGKTGSLADVPESELDSHATVDQDKVFSKFQKQIQLQPDQVVRYERDGKPLYISNDFVPETIPECERCGSPRQFEFQIMPQLLAMLKQNDLDWGVLLVYTCKKSCNKIGYKKEVIYKQDVSENKT